MSKGLITLFWSWESMGLLSNIWSLFQMFRAVTTHKGVCLSICPIGILTSLARSSHAVIRLLQSGLLSLSLGIGKLQNHCCTEANAQMKPSVRVCWFWVSHSSAKLMSSLQFINHLLFSQVTAFLHSGCVFALCGHFAGMLFDNLFLATVASMPNPLFPTQSNSTLSLVSPWISSVHSLTGLEPLTLNQWQCLSRHVLTLDGPSFHSQLSTFGCGWWASWQLMQAQVQVHNGLASKRRTVCMPLVTPGFAGPSHLQSSVPFSL